MVGLGFKAKYWSLPILLCFWGDVAEYWVQLLILPAAKKLSSPDELIQFSRWGTEAKTNPGTSADSFEENGNYYDVGLKAQSTVGETEAHLTPTRLLFHLAGLLFWFTWLSTYPSERTIFLCLHVLFLHLFGICFHPSSVTVVFLAEF